MIDQHIAKCLELWLAPRLLRGWPPRGARLEPGDVRKRCAVFRNCILVDNFTGTTILLHIQAHQLHKVPIGHCVTLLKPPDGAACHVISLIISSLCSFACVFLDSFSSWLTGTATVSLTASAGPLTLKTTALLPPPPGWRTIIMEEAPTATSITPRLKLILASTSGKRRV